MKRHILLAALAMFVLSSCEFSIGGGNSNSNLESNISEATSTPTQPSEQASTSESTSVDLPSTSQNSAPSTPSEELGIELLKDADFNSLSSWIVDDEHCALNIITHQNGTAVMEINNQSSDEVWKPQFLQRDIGLVANHQYRVTFTIQCSVSRQVMFRLQSNDYNIMAIEKVITLSANNPYTFEETITISDTTNYLFGFMLGAINNQVTNDVHTVTITKPSVKEVKGGGEGLNGTTTPAPTTMMNRTLVWNDEFNDSSIDANKWGYEIGTGSWGWGNNEQQYYTNSQSNSYVSNGSLKIVARKENYMGSNYTSARMITKNKYSFRYGYIEARIALPSSMGIWPAFWMLGTNIDSVGWPLCGEIDIMEAVNNNNTVYTTIHYKNEIGHEEYGQNYNVSNRTTYHTYGFEWSETTLAGYVDNVKMFETNNDGYRAQSFKNEFYILLNVAVGGQWPGYNIADNFPQVMSVDYVRVYQ